jgi:cation diffusion facilitator CzcD-associated flavoprotein CzcO
MYAVIGAGPMGLAVARNLDRQGIAFTGFELHSDVGGLWDIDNPHSTMYETAHLISSKTTTEFAEFPMPRGVATYPRHDAMCRYFRSYARHFDLMRHYEFSTRVIGMKRDGDGWLVTTESGGRQQTRRFAGVLIASGTLHHPNMPRFEGGSPCSQRRYFGPARLLLHSEIHLRQADRHAWRQAQTSASPQADPRFVAGAGSDGQALAIWPA